MKCLLVHDEKVTNCRNSRKYKINGAGLPRALVYRVVEYGVNLAVKLPLLF
jgi:hypothetical protein